MFGEPKQSFGVALSKDQLEVLVEAARHVATNTPGASRDDRKLLEAVAILEAASNREPKLLRNLMWFTSEVALSGYGPCQGNVKVRYARSPHRQVEDVLEPSGGFQDSLKTFGIQEHLAVPDEFWTLLRATATILDAAIEQERKP